MADRFPLIANSSSNQIQELASGDTLDLTGNQIDNAVNVKATGIVTFSNTTSSTSTTTGALIVGGGVGIAGSVFIGENLSVGGTVTYEDVTNVDSVGIVTAQLGVIATAGRGVQITAGGLNVDAGIGTFDAGVKLTGGELTLGTGATAFSPASNTLTVGTASTEVVRISNKAGIILNNGILVERCKIVTTAWSSTNDISLDDGNVFLNTANLGGSGTTIDITSSNGLNSDMAIGDCTAVTLITAVNSTSAYINHITIAASAVTESWVGGSAPSDGGGSGYDVYSFNIIKTAANTYVCIANQVKGS